MTDVSSHNFGYLIAYVIPGFVLVSLSSNHAATVRLWIGVESSSTPTVGGFLYVTLASVGAGVGINALRWLLLDFVHHRTGVRRPKLDFSSFGAKQAAFDALAENHFRYYQFFGGTMICLLVAIIDPTTRGVIAAEHPVLAVGGTMAVVVLFFAASRDALKNYYNRTSQLMNRQ